MDEKEKEIFLQMRDDLYDYINEFYKKNVENNVEAKFFVYLAVNHMAYLAFTIAPTKNEAQKVLDLAIKHAWGELKYERLQKNRSDKVHSNDVTRAQERS